MCRSEALVLLSSVVVVVVKPTRVCGGIRRNTPRKKTKKTLEEPKASQTQKPQENLRRGSHFGARSKRDRIRTGWFELVEAKRRASSDDPRKKKEVKRVNKVNPDTCEKEKNVVGLGLWSLLLLFSAFLRNSKASAEMLSPMAGIKTKPNPRAFPLSPSHEGERAGGVAGSKKIERCFGAF